MTCQKRFMLKSWSRLLIISKKCSPQAGYCDITVRLTKHELDMVKILAIITTTLLTKRHLKNPPFCKICSFSLKLLTSSLVCWRAFSNFFLPLWMARHYKHTVIIYKCFYFSFTHIHTYIMCITIIKKQVAPSHSLW